MKNTMRILVALLLVFSLTACDAISSTHIGTQPTRPTIVDVGNVDEIPEEELFTVTLQMNGKPITEDVYFHQMFMELAAKNGGIYAQWNDGYSYYIAKFDENGVAKAAGLDGTYHVTLSDVPGDYIYNVNDYYATNENRQIIVDIYRLLHPSLGDGTGPYYPYVIEFGELGVYELTIDGPDDFVFCRYTPDESGIYQIASWESVAEDKVNPKVDVYGGSVAYAYYRYTLDDGGAEAESGYCKNFSYEQSIAENEVGNVFIFAVRGTAKDEIYPIKVKVAVLKIAELEDRYYTTVMRTEETIRQAPNGVGSFQYAWSTAPDGSPLLDQTLFKLWSVEDGGDGYYHFYDEDKYAATNGWGPTLYAKISQGTTIQSEALNAIEWAGNGNSYLSLMKNNKFFKYKQFIEGFNSLARCHGGNFVGSNYCSAECYCKDPDKEKSCPDLETACLPNCETCHEECSPCPEDMYGAPGYADGTNADGCYPVTEELKEFLQLYAQCHALFSDGNGSAEGMGINSDENSMWLWAVGYYTGDQGGALQMGEEIAYNYGKQG